MRCIQVLDDAGNAPVRGVGGILRRAQVLVRESPHLCDLVRPQASTDLYQAAGGIRTIGRRLPVAVGGAARVGFRVGVPFDQDCVGQLADFLSQPNEQLLPVFSRAGVATLEEHAFLIREQFDAQAFVGDG